MTDGQSAKQAPHWAGLPTEDVLGGLATSRAGLDLAEVTTRRSRYGPNQLPKPPRRPWYADLAANFVHLFALLLWTAAGIALVVGMPQLAWAIVAVILVNGIFGYWQEYQAERAVEALQALLPRQVRVRRQGSEQLVQASEIVPGDVLVLTEGEAVPADARIIAAARLRLDTSSLTGESRPVPRFAQKTDVTGRVAVELPNLAFAGSTVASGCGEAVVFATGAATEFGRIAQLTQIQAERPSPLEREVIRITRVVTILAIGMGVIFFGVGTLLAGLPLAAGFIFTLGIIVANVPEGLLPTLTLSLALAVRRMAGRNALVKRLSAVETLGATTVILTDKTGTLTENEMTVREIWTADRSYRLGGTGYEPFGAVEPLDSNGRIPPTLTELLRAAALCCDARLVPPTAGRRRWGAIGDPTEAAILVAAAKIGLLSDGLGAWPRLAELPFDSTRKRMTTIQEIDGVPVACVKGAPSEVVPRCNSLRFGTGTVAFDNAHRETVMAAHNALAGRGLRVLAVATRGVDPGLRATDGWRVEDIERELTLLGLLAMEDPPRKEVPAAVAACHRAGIRVVMVTGDDGLTAAAIAREIALCGPGARVVAGAELDTLGETELAELLKSREILFARVAPEHKLRLVKAYQQAGAVVAATGDGVNDAPALKRADIGVAMGATGSDVAREAADMVLAEDNFAAIVSAVEEGRAVYDNVRKFLTYVLVSNVPEAAAFAAFALFSIPLPLTVMQVLAIDLGTDLLPALALGMEAPEPDVMGRRPRPRTQRLLDRATILRAYAWLGLIESVLVLGGYFFAFWISGAGTPLPASGSLYAAATTMTFAGIVACQMGSVFACRSPRQSIFELGFTGNRMVLIGIVAELMLLVLLVYFPPLARVFGLAPLGARQWLLLLAFGPILLTLEELRKLLSGIDHLR